MRKFYFLVLLAVLCLGIGWGLSCSSGDDDDSIGDDDTGGDDAADDDSSDDDISDDDTSSDIWTDPSTGLTWQVAYAGDWILFADAQTLCANLSLASGGWRLPTISELRSLIRGCDATMTDGACTVTDSCLDSTCWNDPCGGCTSLAGPASGGAYWPDGLTGVIDFYWSSSTVSDISGDAWAVDFSSAYVEDILTDESTIAVRCVR